MFKSLFPWDNCYTKMCHEENNEGKHYCSNKVLDGKGILLLAFEFSITSYFFNHLKGLFFSPSVYVLEYILDNYIQIFPRPSLGFLILSICSMLTWTLLMVRNASRSLLVGNHLSFHRTLRYWDYEKTLCWCIFTFWVNDMVTVLLLFCSPCSLCFEY